MHGGDLRRVRRKRGARAHPDHDRRNQIAGPGRVIVEQAQHVALAEVQAEFFMEFAQRRLGLGFVRVAAPARQGPLGRMGAQAGRAPGQEKRRPRAGFPFDKCHDDRRTLQRRPGLGGRGAREGGNELCDIPPGGIVKWPDHPA